MAFSASLKQPWWLQRARDLLGNAGPFAEQKYSSIGTEELHNTSPIPFKSSNGRVSSGAFHWSRRRKILLSLLSLILITILFTISWAPDVALAPAQHRDPVLDKSRLHVLVPASKGDFELCKLMLAASVLRYPTPQLINWGVEFKPKKPGELASGTHLGKITGVINWLWTLEDHQMDDLVVVIDAYDLTLQLPPEILINRYYQVNRENDLRMSKKPGMRRAMRDHGFYQTVIFSADKKCSPQYHWQPWCYLQPESPLPVDLYGNITDTSTAVWAGDSIQPYRPRWLNSGMVMGPASDVLAIFLRAYQQMNQEILGSDQSLFNLVFGEQEYMREYWRQQSVKWVDNTPGRIADWISKRESHSGRKTWENMTQAERLVDIVSPFNRDHKLMEPAFDRAKTEYHMGIDYYSRLSKTTVGSEHSVRLYTYNTTPITGNLTRDWRDCHTPDPEFPKDLLQIPPPFPSSLTVGEGSPPLAQSWRDVPLFTELCSGAIPVSIHHNGNKMKREYNWPEMWYHRHLREIIEVRKEEARAAATLALSTGAPVEDINDGTMYNGDKKVDIMEVCPKDLNMVFHGCMWGHGWECREDEVPA